jgi:chloramphenicol O-acetyltransferase type A
MSRYLDISTWQRREQFEFFLHFDKPYFNICVQLDITKMMELRKRIKFSPFLAYHYLALLVANEIEPFRYRLRSGKVLMHDVIHGGSTLLLPNDTFSFVYFDFQRDFTKFARDTNEAIQTVLSGDGILRARDDQDALIHFTTLPWFSFTSFSHARNWGREDSVPKIAFGRFSRTHDQVFLPMSVEVHHALMDGVHVGKFVNQMESALLTPEDYLKLSY